MRDVDVPERQPTAGQGPVLELGGDRDVGDLAGRGGVVGVGRDDHRHALVEVQRLHQPGLPAVDVDRAGMRRVVGAGRVHGADHPTGRLLDELEGAAAGGPEVGQVGGPAPIGPEPATRPAPQQARLGQLVEHRTCAGPEQGQVGLHERGLVRGRAQVRTEDDGVVRVEDRRLDRLAQQGLGMVDEIGVEGVVPGHEDGQRVLGSPPGPADLLPEGGTGPGEPRHQHGVEAADVDAELERVGRGQSDELARRAGPPPAPVVPPGGSRRGRRPPAPGAMRRPRPGAGRRSWRPARRPGGTGRTPASARPRPPGRPAGRRSRTRRLGGPVRRSHRSRR